MGEGLTRRRYGRSHPGSGTGAWAVHPPRWTLGENPSSQTGRDLAPKARTAQNFRNQWLRISGTHSAPNYHWENGSGHRSSDGWDISFVWMAKHLAEIG